MGASSVQAIRPDPTLVTVRQLHAARRSRSWGRLVTVKSSTAQQLKPGQSAVFYTRSWIHADNVAVHEVARMDTTAEAHAVAAVQALPEAHLRDRLTAAERVAVGEVTSVNPLPNQLPGRHAPNWVVASVRIDTPIKGGKDPVTILCPTATTVEWYRSPQFQKGQRGVLMHRSEPRAVRWIDQQALGGAALTALDPADVQPEADAARIRGLLGSAGAQR